MGNILNFGGQDKGYWTLQILLTVTHICHPDMGVDSFELERSPAGKPDGPTK
jgi:hypothetical protein